MAHVHAVFVVGQMRNRLARRIGGEGEDPFVKTLAFVVLSLLMAALIPCLCAAAPVIPGLSGKHPLTESQAGELLLGELRCLACHSRKGGAAPLERTAPELSDVGSRVAPDFLRRFIAAPSASHSGTTMPDLLAGESKDERDKIAEAITHFLVAQSPRKYQRQAAGGKEASEGRALFHTVGCIACHSPRDDAGKEIMRDGVVDLGHVNAKYSLSSLADFLFQPARVRPSGRMPDMKLTTIEAKAIASYLLGKADSTPTSFKPRDELIALGKKHFQRFNCAACHKLGEIPAAPVAVDLGAANLERGCLAKTPAKAPHFHLSDEQTKAIRAALTKRPELISDKVRLATTLTAFNCIACHIRDEFGGVSPDATCFSSQTPRTSAMMPGFRHL